MKDNVITRARTIGRFVVIAGPCSIHEWEGPYEIACRMAKLQKDVESKITLVMRAYVDKPRTGEGWDGIIHEQSPVKIHDQLQRLANKIPIGTEILDLELAKALDLDRLLTFGCVGARTVTSQPHRRFAAQAPYPVLFKNAVDGTLRDAINACRRAINNPYPSVVLRGSESAPNYDRETVGGLRWMIRRENLPSEVFIDCSHGNSCKDHTKQAEVFRTSVKYYQERLVRGTMLEMNINEGRTDDHDQVGTSVTDACIGWEEFEQLIREAYEQLNGE